MNIEYDAEKRNQTLLNRGLDFARAAEIFLVADATQKDTRFDYGEDRFITYGQLDGRWVVMVWTPRGTACRIISMRHAHEREIARSQLD